MATSQNIQERYVKNIKLIIKLTFEMLFYRQCYKYFPTCVQVDDTLYWAVVLDKLLLKL